MAPVVRPSSSKICGPSVPNCDMVHLRGFNVGIGPLSEILLGGLESVSKSGRCRNSVMYSLMKIEVICLIKGWKFLSDNDLVNTA